jgi:hypothetical protein
MKTKLFLLVTLLLTALLFAVQAGPARAGSSDCYAVDTGGIPVLTSLNFDYTCSAAQTVYFGVCDSGGVPNDDLFDIKANGLLVSYNYYVNGIDEYTVMSQFQASAGVNSATMTSLNAAPATPATYSYVVSSDPSDIPTYLSNVCGVDWKGLGSGPNVGCDTSVDIFTTDTAPSNGTLEFHVLLGNEGAFGDEIQFATINVSEGEQLNNVTIPGLPAPRYMRLWWQPAGSSDWSLLTTQYWHGGGSLADEYGVSCNSTTSGQPSYHTSFASAVPESQVCFDLINGCQ